MKKLVSLVIFCLMVFGIYAQNSAVIKALQFKESGELMKAKEEIDLATAHEKTIDKPKTWFTKGEVYEAIALSDDPQYKDMQDEALNEAVEAYDKAKSMDEGGNYAGLSDIKIDNIWGTMINMGAEAYNQEDYDNALTYFEKSSLLKPSDTTGYYYAGIAAQQGEMYDEALENYYKLIDLDYHNEDIYSSVIYLERSHNNDNETALEVIGMAREHFPENETLMKEEINLLILTEQTDEAKSRLESAIQAEPDNANLYYNLAYISEQTGDDEAAVVNYEKAIAADPNYFDATFNLAVIHYNKAAEILKEANEMDLRTYQKEGKAIEEKAKLEFQSALPFLEKAHEIKPDDRVVLETLQTVYVQLKMNDKAEVLNSKLESMGSAEE
jgi:tetratricopeptide (TPR) repeat protein